MGVENKLNELIVAVIILFFGIALIPTVSDYCYDVNTTTLALSTGGAGAVTLLGFIPFIYTAAIIVGGMVALWKIAG